MRKSFLFMLLLVSSIITKAQLPTELVSKLQDTLVYFKNQYNVKGISAAVSFKNYGECVSAPILKQFITLQILFLAYKPWSLKRRNFFAVVT